MIILIVILLLVLFLLSMLSSSAETALFAANRYDIKALAGKGSRRAKLVLAILKHPERVLAALLFLNTLANVSMAAIVTTLVADWVSELHRNLALILTTVVLTIVLLIFAEFVPKTFAARHANRLALALIQPLRVAMAVSLPVIRIGELLGRRLLGSKAEESAREAIASEVVLQSLIDESAATAGVERHQMLRGVLALSDLAVKAVIIPRSQITAVPLEATPEEILETIRTTGYSRIPVYRGDLDHIAGILHSKDVLPRLMQQMGQTGPVKEGLKLQTIMRKPLFVPDSAKVDQTLKYMQKNHIHMAVVIDEHGGVEGLATLEDLLEQIVGEIQDEHDFELDSIRRLANGTVLVDADVSIREINKRLKWELPESNHYSTLGGFLMAHTGRLLQEGDRVQYEHRRFTINATEGRRLVKILVEPNIRTDTLRLTTEGDR
ncbi:MAG: hemolysin family protein [Acidobacteriia bacterium]|nr:hemolysin family protein [Terriglobia bacterium]